MSVLVGNRHVAVPTHERKDGRLAAELGLVVSLASQGQPFGVQTTVSHKRECAWCCWPQGSVTLKLVPPTHSDDQSTTVRDAIQDLDGIEAGGTSESDPLHKSSGLSPKNLDRIHMSTPGGTWRDCDYTLRAACHSRDSGRTNPSVYSRMEWDRPAPTIRHNSTGSAMDDSDIRFRTELSLCGRVHSSRCSRRTIRS